MANQPSPERLQQIAQRKLSQWAVPVEQTPDGRGLRGVMTFTGRVLQPVSRAPIFQAHFTVHGHDRLSFHEPPLHLLGAVPFYDVESLSAFETKVQRGLDQRAHALQQVAARFKRLHIPVVVVPDRLVLLGEVTSGDKCFQLEGDPDGGVRISSFQQGRSEPVLAPASMPPLQLEDYPASVDLELHLTTIAPRLVELARQAAQAPARVATSGVEPREPPGETPTLAQITALLGEQAKLARIEAVADFRVGDRDVRLFLTHQGGTAWAGKLVDLVDTSRVLWTDTLDATRVRDAAHLVALVMGVDVPQEAPRAAPPRPTQHDDRLDAPDELMHAMSLTTTQQSPSQAPPVSPAHPPAGGAPDQSGGMNIAPQPGEVWVMPVLVEQDDGREVRYVCTDADGRPYGAPRILPKADFMQVFSAHGVGFRLSIRIEHVQNDVAVYQQLDAAGNARGEPIQLGVHQLAGAFVPEGALY